MFKRHLALMIAGIVLGAVAFVVGLITGLSSAGWVMGILVGIAILVVGGAVIGILTILNIGSSFKEVDEALLKSSRHIRR